MRFCGCRDDFSKDHTNNCKTSQSQSQQPESDSFSYQDSQLGLRVYSSVCPVMPCTSSILLYVLLVNCFPLFLFHTFMAIFAFVVSPSPSPYCRPICSPTCVYSLCSSAFSFCLVPPFILRVSCSSLCSTAAIKAQFQKPFAAH